MANIYGATSLTGGGAEALDVIDGTDLANGDVAMVVTTSETYHYTLDATSGAAENSPYIISPDTNAGTKRWILKQPESTTIQYPSNAIIGGHISTLQNFIEHINSSAGTGGFDLIDNLDGTINIDAGSALLRNTTDVHTSTIEEYDVPSISSMSLTDNATNYIFAEYNAGTPQLVAYTTIPETAGLDKTPTWFITRVGNDIHTVDMRNYGLNYACSNSKKDFYTKGFEHIPGGSVVIEGSTDRSLDVTAGSFYLCTVKIDHDAFDTNTTDGPDIFTLIYRDGVGGWTRISSQKTLSNINYDDGDGTLGTLSSNDYGIFFIYIVLNVPSELFVLYGQGSYATLAEAQSAETPASLPPEISPGSSGILIAKVIIQDSTTNFAEIQSPFIQALQSSTPISHNGLGGLQGGALTEYYHITQDEHTTLPAKYISASTDPVANNDGVDTAALGITFEQGDEWYRDDTGDQWCCTDNTTGAAVWGTMLIDPFSNEIRIVSNVTVGHKHTIHDYLRHVGSSMPIDGLDLTDNLNGTVDITSGTAILRNTSDIHTSTFIEYDVSAVTSFTLTDDTTNYIMVNYNAGSPQIQAYTSFPAGYGTTITPIWFITRVGTDLHTIDMRGFGLNHTGNVAEKDYNVYGFEHVPGGTILSEIDTRKLSVTTGIFYIASSKITQSAFDTSGSDIFTYIYDDGAGDWTRVTGQTTISNTQYDDGDGILGTIPSNDYGVHWVFIAFDDTAWAHLYVVYGRQSYNTLADAQAAELPSTDMAPEVKAGSASVFVGKIIILESDTNFTEIQSPFLQVLGSAVPTTHNGLGGLNLGDYRHLTAAEYGNIFAPAYGSMWIDDNITAEAVLTTAGNYYKILAFDNDGPSTSDITPDSTTGKDITITDAGDYEITVGLSFTGGNDETYHIAVFADDVQIGALTFERSMATTDARVGVGAVGTIVTLAAADVLDLRVSSDISSDGGFIAHWGSLTVKKVKVA